MGKLGKAGKAGKESKMDKMNEMLKVGSRVKIRFTTEGGEDREYTGDVEARKVTKAGKDIVVLEVNPGRYKTAVVANITNIELEPAW